MKAKHKKKTAVPIKSCIAWVASFAAPMIVFCIVAAACSVYPFGDQSFLSEDLRYQYVDFYGWFKEVLEGQASLFYAPNQALGTNAWGLYSYYLASPFNFLIAVFPKTQITLFVFVATGLKLSCIQVTTMFFLKKRFNLNLATAFVLAICFVWSTWVATQLRNPQWLDALILLPLMALGAHALVTRRKYILLLVTAFLTVVTCWYTAYMCFLFLLLYGAFECYLLHLENNQLGAWDALRTWIRIPVALLVSLCLSAFTFIPTVLAMMGDRSSLIAGQPDGSKLLSLLLSPKAFVALAVMLICLALLLLLARMLSSRVSRSTILALILSVLSVTLVVLCFVGVVPLSTTKQAIISGFYLNGFQSLPNVPQFFAGTGIMLGLVSFFAAKGINGHVKASLGFVLFVLFASACVLPLYAVWCGFRLPNGFYNRITFFFVFMSIWAVAYLLSSQRAQVVMKRLVITVLLITAFGMILLLLKHVGLRTFAVAELVLIVCSFALWVLRGEASVKGASKAAVSTFVQLLKVLAVGAAGCVIVLELVIGAIGAWRVQYTGYQQSYHDEYVESSVAAHGHLKNDDDAFYRMSKTYTRITAAALNEALSVGYLDLSSYSSAHDGDAIFFLNSLGYSKEGQFWTRYAEPILPSDSLLGVKYVWSVAEPYGFESTGIVDSVTGATLYKNPFALPLAYLANEQLVELNFLETNSPFQRQNMLASAMTGRECALYRPCVFTETSKTDISRSWKVDVPAGKAAYLCVLAPQKEEPCLISVDGGETIEENARFQQSIHCFAWPEEEVRTYEVKMDGAWGGPLNDVECVFCYLDLDELRDVVDYLGVGEMRVTQWGPDRIEGRVDVLEGRDSDLLMVSVPYDVGWNATINDRAVETVSVADGALTGIQVEPGSLELKMWFTPPGLKAGCLVTAVTAVLLMAVGIHAYRTKRKHE